jgi:hypothetical protein
VAFNLSTGGSGNSQILPHFKYNAKSGRMTRVDRDQDSAGNWQSSEVDITGNAVFVLDMQTVEVGWLQYQPTPAFKTVPLGQPLPASPGDSYKQGFSVLAFSDKNLKGVRQWTSSAGVTIEAVEAIHDAYLEKGAKQVPVVQMTGSEGISSKHGTNYKPTFKIVKWVDRPAEFDAAKAAPTPDAAAAPTPSSAPDAPAADDEVLF